MFNDILDSQVSIVSLKKTWNLREDILDDATGTTIQLVGNVPLSDFAFNPYD